MFKRRRTLNVFLPFWFPEIETKRPRLVSIFIYIKDSSFFPNSFNRKKSKVRHNFLVFFFFFFLYFVYFSKLQSIQKNVVILFFKYIQFVLIFMFSGGSSSSSSTKPTSKSRLFLQALVGMDIQVSLYTNSFFKLKTCFLLS